MQIPMYSLDIGGGNLFRTDEKTETLLPQDYFLRRSARIALLDRDGVIVPKARKHEYWTCAEDMQLLEGVAEAIRHLNRHNVPAIIVTNQPGIASRKFSMHELYVMSESIQQKLETGGSHLDGIFFCPHAKDAGCTCRKPLPGMISAAMNIYCSRPEETFVFGDFASDIEAAVNSCAIPVWIATQHDEYESNQEIICARYPEVFTKSRFGSLLDAVIHYIA